ncbi:MAG: hypothetical protein IID63_02420, partial [candidate division Zixibacteria bacterium]|nr:hypothetical protein [candidate division Zixibacteria bacterium]
MHNNYNKLLSKKLEKCRNESIIIDNNSLPRMQQMLVGDLCHLDAFHGLAQSARAFGNLGGVFVMGGGIDYRFGAF